MKFALITSLHIILRFKGYTFTETKQKNKSAGTFGDSQIRAESVRGEKETHATISPEELKLIPGHFQESALI